MNEKTQAYLRNRVMSATPEQLRLMLVEGALRFAHQGRAGIEARNPEQAYEGIHQCQSILLELVNSLDHAKAPDLCRNLAGLYMFMYRRLIEALLEKDVKPIDEVIALLEHERETWVMLMDKLAQERREPAAGSNAANGDEPVVASICVEG